MTEKHHQRVRVRVKSGENTEMRWRLAIFPLDDCFAFRWNNNDDNDDDDDVGGGGGGERGSSSVRHLCCRKVCHYHC